MGWENDHQYTSKNGKKPPKLASKDLSSDWSKIYGKTQEPRNYKSQLRTDFPNFKPVSASNGDWNEPTVKFKETKGF